MITVIPAKIGSERVPLKNIRDVGGYPLVLWTLTAARLLEYPIYLMTDSTDIAKLGEGFTDKIILCEQKGDKFLIETLCQELKDMPEVIYLRPTTPFRDIKTLKDGVDYFLQNNLYSMRSAHEMSEPVEKMYQEPSWPFSAGHDEANRPSQEMPKTYHPNGYIDITKTEKLNKGLFLDPFKLFITPKTIEIDTEYDLDYANYYLSQAGHPLLDYMRILW